GAADTWTHYLWLVDTQQQNDELVEQNRKLQNELDRFAEVKLANERLRKLLNFKEEV
ncbi:MAG: rod shape-determining protein MreC, partial [Desulfuromonadales bacterium]|nr:rod shape-determining protein MreC [Desulfuromonadales bacterium]